MQRTEKQERTYTADQIVSVTCDHCGNEMLDTTHKTRFSPGWLRGAEVEVRAHGYGSRYDDEGPWRFDVCDDCIPKLLSFFGEDR